MTETSNENPGFKRKRPWLKAFYRNIVKTPPERRVSSISEIPTGGSDKGRLSGSNSTRVEPREKLTSLYKDVSFFCFWNNDFETTEFTENTEW